MVPPMLSELKAKARRCFCISDTSANDTNANGDTSANGSASTSMPGMKLIIDTDPGIDDAILAIFMAFASPELDVISMTTIFGNCTTDRSTINYALHLCEFAERLDIPVAEGCTESLSGMKPKGADFVHGSGGLGNKNPPPPQKTKIDQHAVDFLIDTCKEFPNEVTILALGPLTNIAKAIKKDPTFAKNVKKLYVLGGFFFSGGDINPAGAEANIYNDPEAADIVFTCGADTVVIGRHCINLTTKKIMTEADLQEVKKANPKYGEYIYDICSYYKGFHLKSDGLEGVFLHGPGCLASLLKPNLFTYKNGVLRVETQGPSRGMTHLDFGLKDCTSKPQLSLGWFVNGRDVVELVKDRLKKL